MTPRRRFILAGSAVLTALVFWPVSNDRLHRFYPLRFVSKENILLREFRNANGAYSSTLTLEKYPPLVVRAVMVAEDARFAFHSGIDPVAILRAAAGNLRRGGIHSGASTITQQLARTIYADSLPQNRYLRKLAEALFALKITATVSKAHTLEAYLNQVPMPMNSAGLAAAAERIFAKHISLVSDEEAVALAVLIRSGSFRGFEARFRLLWHKLGLSRVPDLTALKSALAKISAPRDTYVSGSEHFTAWLRENNLPAYGEIHSEISANLNRAVSEIIRSEMRAVYEAGADHAAVVVFEKTGDTDALRAMVGSADFFSAAGGEINHAVRVRSAGSTLKPFVYGLGFEKKIFHAGTVFFDGETALPTGREHETYRPQNNDMRFWGQMTLREALVSSRNIPALAAANQIGVGELLIFLRRAGLYHLTEAADHYGPGLALGSGGVTLVQLARLYSALAAQGTMQPLQIGSDTEGHPLYIGTRQKLFSPETAARLTHMLSDRALRRRAFGRRNFLDFPFAVAAKTGTSKDYRDGWVAGYTPRFTVAVWVGNSRGTPMRQVSGAWGAGRIFQQVMRLVAADDHRGFKSAPQMHEIFVCRKTGLSARAGCPAHAELAPRAERLPAPCGQKHTNEESRETPVPVLVSPAPGERYVLHPGESAARQEIPIIIRAGGGKYSYALGDETPKTTEGDVRDFRRLGAGDYVLRIRAGDELIEEAFFSVR